MVASNPDRPQGATVLFTPRLAHHNDARLHMHISEADWQRFTELDLDPSQTCEVTDLDTGKTWTVRRASCTLDCACDALAWPAWDVSPEMWARMVATVTGSDDLRGHS